MNVTRYGVYFVPDGAWGDAGAAWLGWDTRRGVAVGAPHPELTERPRKYGFHATLKAPFFLNDGAREADLLSAVDTLAKRMPAVALGPLDVSVFGRFLALTAAQAPDDLNTVASAIVADLDSFRAPPDAAELERRRKRRLSETQEVLLQRWGYPHVMEAFNFHMTLTGRMKDEAHAIGAARAHFAPVWDQPLSMDAISVVGQGEDGLFRQLERFALTG